MKYALLAGAAALAVINPAAFAQTPSIDPALRDVIIVTASRTNTETTDVASPEDQPAQGHDVTHLLSRVPGGARVGNGALSGQAQYRGLFGERLNLRVDGQRFASGGPNLMDPAFHYAPAPLVAAMMIDRGVSPVSEGPGLAGGMDAVFKRIDFSGGPATTFGYDVSADARTVDDSTSLEPPPNVGASTCLAHTKKATTRVFQAGRLLHPASNAASMARQEAFASATIHSPSICAARIQDHPATRLSRWT